MDSQDLLNLSFDDVIFVKDAYYYVEKIHDVVIGQSTPVKVDLIKLNNYYPDNTNFVGTDFWEDNSDLWNLEDELWEQA